MNIKPLLIETVLAGAIHLIWITLVTLCILGIPPLTILNYFAIIEPGAAAFLIVSIFSLSFFFGRVTENFIIAINFYIKKKEDKENVIKSYGGTKGQIWLNKIFSFSSFLGLLILGLILFLIAESSNLRWAIIFVGIILLIETASSLLFWNYLEKKVN